METSKAGKRNDVIDFLKSRIVNDLDRFENDLDKNIPLVKKKYKKKREVIQKQENKFLTRKEKNKLGLYRVPKQELKYESLLGMYQMWKDYMNNQMDSSRIPKTTDNNWEQFSSTIHKSDFHGAMISVIGSKSPNNVGLKGICVMDTKNTFKIVGEDSVTRTIPKDSSIFKFHLDKYDFVIYGKHISRRPAERSVRKSKMYSICDL